MKTKLAEHDLAEDAHDLSRFGHRPLIVVDVVASPHLQTLGRLTEQRMRRMTFLQQYFGLFDNVVQHAADVVVAETTFRLTPLRHDRRALLQGLLLHWQFDESIPLLGQIVLLHVADHLVSVILVRQVTLSEITNKQFSCWVLFFN